MTKTLEKLQGSITLTELKIILMEIKFKIGISVKEAVTYLEDNSKVGLIYQKLK